MIRILQGDDANKVQEEVNDFIETVLTKENGVNQDTIEIQSNVVSYQPIISREVTIMNKIKLFILIIYLGWVVSGCAAGSNKINNDRFNPQVQNIIYIVLETGIVPSCNGLVVRERGEEYVYQCIAYEIQEQVISLAVHQLLGGLF